MFIYLTSFTKRNFNPEFLFVYLHKDMRFVLLRQKNFNFAIDKSLYLLYNINIKLFKGSKIMRVITGTARGRKLKTLDSLEIRPTPDAVKEAIFSVVHFSVPGAQVLDLFAGSGQLGIEALSRGAAHCVFVDNSANAIDIVKQNLAACKFTNTRVLHMDSIEYTKVAKPGLDIALLDPPYRKGLLEQALQYIGAKMNPGAYVICEHETELVLKDEYPGLTLHKRYKYGRVAVTIFCSPTEEDDE